jgi:biotin carboxyl carrier protein
MSMRRYTVSIDDRSFVIDVVETAADRFEVSVDGQTFEAALLGDHDLPGSVISPEIPSSEARTGGPLTSVPLPAVAPSGSPSAATRPGTGAAPGATQTRRPAPGTGQAAGRAEVLTAPMPGVVLEVFAAPGATVRRGDPLLVLEAMKMRNTIRSPRDAVIAEVAVAAGQPVGPGDLLVRLGDLPG